MKFSFLIAAALAFAGCDGLSIIPRGGRPYDLIYEAEKRQALQDIITWDEHSLFIRGERVMMFSGEVHPFRLPVPSLYLDVFQKIKALGFNMVSFYIDWALLEGQPGHFRADGIFDLEPFFDAAKDAGIYLLARPGPYINAEASGGGFPGWLQRVPGQLRTNATSYLDSTNNYMSHIGAIIAKAQITNGGPVILVQPENEYSGAEDTPFPNKPYFRYVIDQERNAGIVVPLINNDAGPGGNEAPGTGVWSVDIYGHDAYPLGFDCGAPYTWPAGDLPTDFHMLHEEQSPTTPYSIVEFQGGSYDPFGGWGFDQCATLLNQEFERVFYKNNFAAGVTIMNIYMTFGGTNWGNLGHPGGYTSYDYGASIREDRVIDREKYSELKLEGQFMKVSPNYVITTPGNLSTGVYSPNTAITITPLLGNGTGNFFVARHSDYASEDTTKYTLRLPTSAGTLSIPQFNSSLTLYGRDSKVHVTDYPVGDYSLLYSTAEVFTWKKYAGKTVLVLYGEAGETHEVFVKDTKGKTIHEGSGVTFHSLRNGIAFQWTASSTRQVIQTGDLYIYLVDRNAAYDYWVPVVPSSSNVDGPQYGSSVMNPEAVIVNGGYLVRSVAIDGSTLSVQADFNTSTSLEVIGAPKGVSKLTVNGESLSYHVTSSGTWLSHPAIDLPAVSVPDLSSLTWHYLDSVPEIQASYDDSKWPRADLTHTYNSGTPLLTPVSLFGSDYGFNTGALVFRGHFTASGAESKLNLWTQGGYAYASSVWLDGSFLGSFAGFDAGNDHNDTYTVPNLTKGKSYVLTIIVDSTGLNEDLTPGLDDMKEPRGILDYSLVSASGAATSITWKITGNLGGEHYIDKFRGPLNEGGLYFEREGYHLPGAPLKAFTSGSPYEGVSDAGVGFFATTLSLDLPADKYDIPLSFVFDNATTTSPYRGLLFVNGFQFGKYVQNIGPQDSFPVPEGILNYNGNNWIGLAVWALESDGAQVPNFSLQAGTPVLSSRQPVELVRGPSYTRRPGAY